MRHSGSLTAVLRRFVTSLFLVAAVVLTAAGCADDGAPTSYEATVPGGTSIGSDGGEQSVVQENYINGCTLALEEASGNQTVVDGADAVCRCAWEEIVQTVPFSSFVELDERLRGDLTILQQASLPPNSPESAIVTIVSDCIESV